MTNEMLGKYPQLTGLSKFILLTNAKAKLIAQNYYTLKSGLRKVFFHTKSDFRKTEPLFQ